MKNKCGRYIFTLGVVLAFVCPDAHGGSIRSTKHNLSVTGPGSVKAEKESRICVFCHTPHKSRKGMPYLWNRKDSTTQYTPYQSSTLYSGVGQPTGASKLCLSCHDGTIAFGTTVARPQEIQFKGGIRFMPANKSARLGTDLSDDHPVSFVYDARLSRQKGQLNLPSSLPSHVKLDKSGELQCTGCHDPHDDTYGKFLVSSNRYADLCVSCHEKEGWTNSSHASSSARWNGNGNDPWLNADYDSVAENGCASCHRPHASAKGQRLLKHVFEEDTCLVCHNGNVASTDVETELTKQYVHPVQDYTDVHDPVEDFSSGNAQKHVECGDCHNPHQVGGVSSPGPPSGVPGANRGVKGINSVGRSVSQAQDLYEVCFKCHAGNNVKKNLPVTRGINQLNTSMEFSPGNPSYHPVMAPGVNPDVPSRSNIPNKQSRISCADCHNSDNPNGPKGPHGSSFKHLLERNYTTSDFTDENSYSYGLCYKCHDRNSIMSDESFTEHKKHIVDQKTPCSACHDPHGISSSQGNPINNSHLMNFDLTIVRQNGLGRMEFVDQGRFAGQCYLNCHGKEHGPQQYP